MRSSENIKSRNYIGLNQSMQIYFFLRNKHNILKKISQVDFQNFTLSYERSEQNGLICREWELNASAVAFVFLE